MCAPRSICSRSRNHRDAAAGDSARAGGSDLVVRLPVPSSRKKQRSLSAATSAEARCAIPSAVTAADRPVAPIGRAVSVARLAETGHRAVLEAYVQVSAGG
jgi:hypothetical protein